MVEIPLIIASLLGVFSRGISKIEGKSFLVFIKIWHLDSACTDWLITTQMSYLSLKALHIIFVITWFSGLFYMVRLFVYAAEANSLKDPIKRQILIEQYQLMQKRLWYGIAWPSAILTAILGSTLVYLYGSIPGWLWAKLLFVLCLYLYHFSCHRIFLEQGQGIFEKSPLKLRIWNEAPTPLLFGIVFAVVLKDQTNFIFLLLGLFIVALLLLIAIKQIAKRN